VTVRDRRDVEVKMQKGARIAVFVDRDGTICFDKHYLSDPNGLELIPTVAEGIKRLNEAKLMVIVVTNQSGVRRGYFTEETLKTVHDRLRQILASRGARIDDVFYCPHRPDEGCICRKPAPGMLIQARDKHGLDLTRSFVIGDRMMDVGMAHSVGAKGILVPEPGDQYNIEKEIRESTTKPDFRADTFVQAVDWILERPDKKD
jgi:D-glycero-D-manno-heptose 1,7-bisphosphate phosphatase